MKFSNQKNLIYYKNSNWVIEGSIGTLILNGLSAFIEPTTTIGSGSLGGQNYSNIEISCWDTKQSV